MAERAGIDASIPLQVKRPDMMGRISDLIGMQHQQTALKSEQQSQRQRANLASFDMSKIIGDDGTIDLNKIPGSGLREASGDQFPEVMQKFMTVKQQQIAAKQGLVNLTNAQRAAFGDMVGALRSDPAVAQDNTPEGRQRVAETFAQYAEMYPDAQGVLRSYAGTIANAPPGKLAQVIQNIQLQATSASEQAARQAPQYQSTGQELRNVNPYAQPGQAPGSIPLSIAPGQQETLRTDQAGRPVIESRDPRGNISGYVAAPGMETFDPGEIPSIEQQAEANFQNVNANRIAAQSAPQQIDQINKALSLAEGVSTGGGGDFARKRANFESALSIILPGFDPAAGDATKLQMLDKYLERIAADSARVLGANATTDASRESIARQNASSGYTTKAVQEVLKYAKAQTHAMAAKGDAQEKWLQQKGNGITKQHQFETQWRQAYDPRLFQLDAMSPSEQDAYTKKLSSQDKRELAQKLDKLSELGVEL